MSVSALTALIKNQLESITDLWVEGELSGVKMHTSGHCYFSLKDSGAQISCTLWRSQVARLRIRLEDGQKVLVRGALSVYEPRGTYSLNVQQVEPRGVGELQLAFEQLKRRLAAEGLFEPARKRPMPYLVNQIGIVTSPTGAALQDMLKIIFRRNPNTTVVVCPAKVQGAGAAEEVALGIERLNALGSVQVIIVGRGGGSIEDLWCFNEEVVARAIFASRLPVVSAVGHEVDFTIADFVSDLRAPTPSAAAELVVRDRRELDEGIRQLSGRLQRAMAIQLQTRKNALLGLSERLRDPRRRLADQRRALQSLDDRLLAASMRAILLRKQQLQGLTGKLGLLSPDARIEKARGNVAILSERIERNMTRLLAARRARFERVVATLDALSPLNVLGRGYAIVQRIRDLQVLHRADQVQPGEGVRIRLHAGVIECKVETVLPEAPLEASTSLPPR